MYHIWYIYVDTDHIVVVGNKPSEAVLLKSFVYALMYA